MYATTERKSTIRRYLRYKYRRIVRKVVHVTLLERPKAQPLPPIVRTHDTRILDEPEPFAYQHRFGLSYAPPQKLRISARQYRNHQPKINDAFMDYLRWGGLEVYAEVTIGHGRADIIGVGGGHYFVIEGKGGSLGIRSAYQAAGQVLFYTNSLMRHGYENVRPFVLAQLNDATLQDVLFAFPGIVFINAAHPSKKAEFRGLHFTEPDTEIYHWEACCLPEQEQTMPNFCPVRVLRKPVSVPQLTEAKRTESHTARLPTSVPQALPKPVSQEAKRRCL